MNQILLHKSNLKKKKHFLLVFAFSVLLCILLIIFYLYSSFQSSQNEKLSQSYLQSFQLSTLYVNQVSENSSAQKLENSLSSSEPFVIGIIEIPAIKLAYPILSTTTDELLKISPCRFAGPMPNEIGNLCIAGHNNANGTLFGKTYLLDLEDEIKLYDLSGNAISYTIFDKFEVEASNTSCLSQDTNGEKQVTLITCNNLKGSRTIIQAKTAI